MAATSAVYLNSALDNNGGRVMAYSEFSSASGAELVLNAAGNDVGSVDLWALAILKIGVNNPFLNPPVLSLGQVSSNIGGATLDLAGHSVTLQQLTGAPNSLDPTTTTDKRKVTNSVIGTTSTLTLAGPSASNFDGVIEDGAGQVAVVLSGATTYTLKGTVANTHTGETRLQGVAGSSTGTLLELSKSNGVTALAGDARLLHTTLDNTGRVNLRLRANEQIADTAHLIFEGGSVPVRSGAFSGVASGSLILFGHVETVAGLVSATPGAGAIRHAGGNSIGDLPGPSSLILRVPLGESHDFSGFIYDHGDLGALGSVMITKDGPGQQAFSGENIYSMGTAVLDGTLLINNTTGSGTGIGNVTVAAAGTLGGTGAVLPSTGNTVVVNGTISPGNPATNGGIGTLTLSNLNLSGGGVYPCQISGGSSDKLAVNDALNVTNGTLEITATSPTAPVYVLASYGSLAGTFASVTGIPAGYTLDYHFGGNSIALVATPYQSWLTTYGMSSSVGGLTQDPDQDGWANLLEFATGGHPLAGGENTRRRGAVSDLSGQNYLTLTLPLPTGAVFSGSPLSATVGGITYIVHGDDNLSGPDAFTAQAVIPALSAGLPAAGSGYSYRTFRIPTPAGVANPKGFLWLQVTITP